MTVVYAYGGIRQLLSNLTSHFMQRNVQSLGFKFLINALSLLFSICDWHRRKPVFVRSNIQMEQMFKSIEELNRCLHSHLMVRLFAMTLWSCCMREIHGFYCSATFKNQENKKNTNEFDFIFPPFHFRFSFCYFIGIIASFFLSYYVCSFHRKCLFCSVSFFSFFLMLQFITLFELLGYFDCE